MFYFFLAWKINNFTFEKNKEIDYSPPLTLSRLSLISHLSLDSRLSTLNF